MAHTITISDRARRLTEDFNREFGFFEAPVTEQEAQLFINAVHPGRGRETALLFDWLTTRRFALV